MEDLAKLIDGFMEMQDGAEDTFAAGLYRAMFRHETDWNRLDWEYADHIFDSVTIGMPKAIEDYRNYIQYVGTFDPETAQYYQNELDKELKNEEGE